MAIKKTLAQNHLSKYGRFGDTEMVRTSEGEDWHVNPEEKSLINMYGKKGEKLVDAMGSGTTNPYTGKEEKFIFEALTLGVTAYSAWKGGSEASKQAETQAKLSRLQIDEANKALGSLGQSKEAKEQVAEQEFQFGLEGLSGQTGIAKEDLQKQTSEAVRKSGLATSGTIEGKKSTMWKRIEGSFTRGQEGLMGQLGKAMGGIEEWFEGETSRLQGIKKRASLQIKAYEKQAGGWYLGKKIGEFFS